MKMIKLIPLMLLSSMLLINCGGDGKNGAVSNDNLLSEDYIFIEPVVPPVPTPPTPTPPGPTPPTPSINTAPVADAGNKQDVKLNTLVTLNGSGSYDVDGDPLTYKWVMVDKPTGSSATLSSASSITPTFTADKDGHYRVKLRVHDGKVNSPVDTVYITVNTPLPSNTAPTAVAKGTSHVVVVRGEDHEVLLDGTDSYDDGLVVPLTYKWTSGPYVVNKSTVHAKPTCADNWTVCYNADQRPICSYNVKLSVYDGEFTDTDTFNLTVDYSACEHDPVKPISSIHLDPAYQQSIPVTKHKTYKLWVYYKDNTTKDVTTDAKLSTSQSSIATIDAHGKVTGNAVGDVLIKASYKGFTDTAPLTVTN